jgi:hypothetical protein
MGPASIITGSPAGSIGHHSDSANDRTGSRGFTAFNNIQLRRAGDRSGVVGPEWVSISYMSVYVSFVI